MSRYINYDAIDYRHCEIFDKSEEFHNGILHMAKRIEEAPSIDLEIADDGTLIIKLPDATAIKRVLVQDEKYGDLYYTDGSAEGFDKEYVLSELSDLLDEYSEMDENGLHDPKWCGVKEAYGVVKTAPPADRPQGEWIFKTVFPNDKSEFPMGYLVCSVCGSHHSNSTPCNYCDNCGAKMKGADDEEISKR